MGQNLVPLVNIKIAGKWMFIPLKMVLIGIDPYPYKFHRPQAPNCRCQLSQTTTGLAFGSWNSSKDTMIIHDPKWSGFIKESSRNGINSHDRILASKDLNFGKHQGKKLCNSVLEPVNPSPRLE